MPATSDGSDRPPVGRLFAEPRPRCDACGARVLELLYCQPCGEVFVGGYKKSDVASNNAWYLSPDYPNLERVPDKAASLSRTFGEFLLFWPADGKTLFKRTHAGPKWKWQQDNARGYQWKPAACSHALGRLALRQQAAPSAPGESAGLCVPRAGGRRERLSVKVPALRRRLGRPPSGRLLNPGPRFGLSTDHAATDGFPDAPDPVGAESQTRAVLRQPLRRRQTLDRHQARPPPRHRQANRNRTLAPPNHRHRRRLRGDS